MSTKNLLNQGILNEKEGNLPELSLSFANENKYYNIYKIGEGINMEDCLKLRQNFFGLPTIIEIGKQIVSYIFFYNIPFSI